MSVSRDEFAEYLGRFRSYTTRPYIGVGRASVDYWCRDVLIGTVMFERGSVSEYVILSDY